MKKYNKPEAILESIEIEEIIMSSGLNFGGSEPGDTESGWPF